MKIDKQSAHIFATGSSITKLISTKDYKNIKVKFYMRVFSEFTEDRLRAKWFDGKTMW